VLQLKALGVEDVVGFDFMDKPPRAAVVRWVASSGARTAHHNTRDQFIGLLLVDPKPPKPSPTNSKIQPEAKTTTNPNPVSFLF
jgi:hypothetical protein